VAADTQRLTLGHLPIIIKSSHSLNSGVYFMLTGCIAVSSKCTHNGISRPQTCDRARPSEGRLLKLPAGPGSACPSLAFSRSDRTYRICQVLGHMRDVPGQHHCDAASKAQCIRTSFWESGAASHNRKKLSNFNFESGKRNSELLPSRTLCPKNPKGVIGRFATASAKVRPCCSTLLVQLPCHHIASIPRSYPIRTQ
jgi:hypothetical protein